MPEQLDLKPTEYRVKSGAFAKWQKSRVVFLERHRKWMLRWATFAGVWLAACIQVAPILTWIPEGPLRWAYLAAGIAPAAVLAIVAIAKDD